MRQNTPISLEGASTRSYFRVPLILLGWSSCSAWSPAISPAGRLNWFLKWGRVWRDHGAPGGCSPVPDVAPGLLGVLPAYLHLDLWGYYTYAATPLGTGPKRPLPSVGIHTTGSAMSPGSLSLFIIREVLLRRRSASEEAGCIHRGERRLAIGAFWETPGMVDYPPGRPEVAKLPGLSGDVWDAQWDMSGPRKRCDRAPLLGGSMIVYGANTPVAVRMTGHRDGHGHTKSGEAVVGGATVSPRRS